MRLWYALAYLLLLLWSIAAGSRILLWLLGRVSKLSCGDTIETTDRGTLGPCILCAWHLGPHQFIDRTWRRITFDGDAEDYTAYEV